MSGLLDAHATAQRLPYPRLAGAIAGVLADASVQVPPRIVQPLAGGASLFVMPAADAHIAITKLISYTPANAGTQRPVIQGDVVVFDVATGVRRLILDGPTATARRTAAVSLLAAQRLAARPEGPLLIVGAGAQGRAHLDAFAAGLAQLREVRIASRTRASAQALADHAATLGLRATVVDDPDAALAGCGLVVTCTPADSIVISRPPDQGTFIAAVGAFTPRMVELAPGLCRHCLAHGEIWLDAADARHEAGDLLQAGIDVAALPALADWPAAHTRVGKTMLFKSCGWAGWDLAAARCAIESGQ